MKVDTSKKRLAEEVKRAKRKKKLRLNLKKKLKRSIFAGSRLLTTSNGGRRVYAQTDSGSDNLDDWSDFAMSVIGKCDRKPNAMETDEEHVQQDTPRYHAELDKVHNRTVVLLHQGQTLVFRGKGLLTCLYGRVEVLGFTIEEGQQPYPVFSPPTNCPLSITATGNGNALGKSKKQRRMEAKAIIRKYLSEERRKKLQNNVNSECCLVLLEPLDTPLTRFLSSLPEHHSLFSFRSVEQQDNVPRPDCPLAAVGILPLRGVAHGLVMSQSYRDSLDTLVTACAEESDGCPIIMVCGPRNTGKSTFIRHLMNTLLNHTTSVDYMECDLGQTEFTPPGCLSLSTVTEPLLGAPFTHQRTPKQMVFYGEATCERDMDRYLESLKFLWRFYSRETAVIINTMGWMRDFGFQLLVDFIRLFSVTHVVQLSASPSPQCQLLTPIYMQTAHGWQTRPPAIPIIQDELDEPTQSPGHILLEVWSEFEEAGVIGNLKYHRSNIVRDLALLSYLSQMQSVSPGPMRPLHCFVPYQVPMTAVAVRVTHSEVAPAHILYTINSSLVGLCCLGENVTGSGGPVLLTNTPVCQCLGFGVVRGINMAKGLYYLITPLEPSVLRQVNCMMVGTVSLPHSLLKMQPGIEGERPYLTCDYSFELSGAGKLRVYKGLMRREHMGQKKR